MMLPRLRLAANLLRDDGVIFISIDDHEQANLKKLCDELFGWDASRFPEDDLVAIGNRLHDMIDRIKPDRTDLDVVYELMLKLGFL